MRGHLPACAISLTLVTSITLAGCTTHNQASPPQAVRATPTASTSVDLVEKTQHGPQGQVVKVAKYGISFELPRGWMTLDLKNVLTSSNPLIEQFARRMGMTPRRLVKTIGTSTETFSITDQGAVAGFVDNVSSNGIPLAHINDDQVKLGLATVGAKPGKFEHASSPVGAVTRVPYTLAVKHIKVHGVSIVVDVGKAATQINVSSHAPAAADELADQIQASLKPID